MLQSRPLARFDECRLALFATLVVASAGAAAQLKPGDGSLQAQAAVSAPSAHNAPQSRADAAFGRADTNGDGQLSRDEAQRLPAVADRFEEIDANGDRLLSREEFLRGIGH